jgi:integrase
MLNFAIDRGMIRHNPLARAKPVSTISQRETWLGAGDVEKLLAAADDVVDRSLREGDDDGRRAALLKAFILCCFDSMLRFNEARHLRIDRIGPDGSVELLASETKGKRRRFVQLTPRTLDAIQEIKRRPGAEWVFEGGSDHPGKERYGKISEGAMRSWFRRACEISGVDERATANDKRARVHDLRAGGATTADMLGARPIAIQAAMGHASFEMTRRYLRSSEAEGARSVGEVMGRAGAPARRQTKGGR